MKRFLNLTIRNIKLYFSDKGMFLTSLITPAILLILFITFLGNIYKDSFLEMIPNGIELSDKLINGLVSGQLVSSLLAVSCITVAFCSNFLMVQDKVNGTYKDLYLTPVNSKTINLSYFVAAFISTFIINLFALILCLIYISFNGCFMNASDILIIIFNIILLTLFGCVLSSVINSVLKTQGQITAVGTIVSSMYGFICGAYMPISSFSSSLRNILSFLPSTYGTALIKNSIINGVFRELGNILPTSVVDSIKTGIDCKLEFFGNNVSISVMYIILIISIIILLIIYIVQSKIKSKK